MKKSTIEITEDQANVLIQLLDVASKARGLEVAQPCAFFHTLIKEAFKKEEEEKDGAE